VAPYTPPAPAADAFAATRTRMEEMLVHLSAPAMAGATAEALEEYVTGAGRELLRQMLQDQFDARAAAEVRVEAVTGTDTLVRRRAERGHRRLLATTLGRVEAARIAYRAPGAASLHVADAALALPQQVYSYPLQRAVALEVAEAPLRRASDRLQRSTGGRLGTRQLMEIACRVAAHIPAFYQQDLPAPAAPAGDERDRLLVLSCDATGVNMIPSDLREAVRTARPDPGPQPPSAQLSSREHTGRRRMATVFAVYDSDPVPRTSADVLPRTAAERAARTSGPRARGRHLEGSLERSTAAMVSAMFDHAEARDPDHRRRWIVLVDGANHQLDCIAREAAARGIHVDTIVDIVHVIEYLSAPRGALSYPPRSGEGLEDLSLGLMAYLDLKGKGDSSMPGNRRSPQMARGGASGGPRDMVKAELPEAESPAGAIRTPSGNPSETGVVPCGASHRCALQPPGRSDSQSGNSRR
jgi:hypothetical protein